jgi:hypothetical protein
MVEISQSDPGPIDLPDGRAQHIHVALLEHIDNKRRRQHEPQLFVFKTE